LFAETILQALKFPDGGPNKPANIYFVNNKMP